MFQYFGEPVQFPRCDTKAVAKSSSISDEKTRGFKESRRSNFVFLTTINVGRKGNSISCCARDKIVISPVRKETFEFRDGSSRNTSNLLRYA